MEYHIGKYLEDNNITEPYYNLQPETSETITTIYSATVPQPDFVQAYANDLVGVKFLTRGNNQVQTRKLAWDIHRSIAQLGGIDITAQDEKVYIVSVDIINPPTFLEVDERGRIVFVSHYSVHAETENNIFRTAV